MSISFSRPPGPSAAVPSNLAAAYRPPATNPSSSLSSGVTEQSRLEADVNQLINTLAASFNNLIHTNTALIGQAERVEEEEDEATGSSGSGGGGVGGGGGGGGTAVSPSNIKERAVDISLLSYSDLHTSLLKQKYSSSVYAANLVDASERLLGVISQLKLSCVLHDRERSHRAVERFRVVGIQRERNEWYMQQLSAALNCAIQECEQHYQGSLEHQFPNLHPDGTTTTNNR